MVIKEVKIPVITTYFTVDKIVTYDVIAFKISHIVQN